MARINMCDRCGVQGKSLNDLELWHTEGRGVSAHYELCNKCTEALYKTLSSFIKGE